MRWTTVDIPARNNPSALVTGTGGLGLEVATQLCRAGYEVILAGRDSGKGEAGVARVRAQIPSARIEYAPVDLASLHSVAELASRLRERRTSLDLLVNNAAVMNPPTRQHTAEGFELQLGTNYLGHFALTARLLPLLRQGDDPRVVTLSSIASREGVIDFDDLQSERSYSPMRAYAQSKLACLMFAFELQRRSEAGRWGVTSLAAHPGVARSNLLHNAPGRWSLAGTARTLLWFLFQPLEQAALPTLFAATSPLAKAGAYYGPDKLGETRGGPTPSKVPPRAEDRAMAERLWRASEELVGLRFAEGDRHARPARG